MVHFPPISLLLLLLLLVPPLPNPPSITSPTQLSSLLLKAGDCHITTRAPIYPASRDHRPLSHSLRYTGGGGGHCRLYRSGCLRRRDPGGCGNGLPLEVYLLSPCPAVSQVLRLATRSASLALSLFVSDDLTFLVARPSHSFPAPVIDATNIPIQA